MMTKTTSILLGALVLAVVAMPVLAAETPTKKQTEVAMRSDYGDARAKGRATSDHLYGEDVVHIIDNRKSGVDETQPVPPGAALIRDPNRSIIRAYLREHADKYCKGKAPDHSGCLPEGWNNQYVTGQPLTTEAAPLPADLAELLTQPAPEGTRFGMVDTDIVLLDDDDNTLIDVVTLQQALE